MKFLARLLAAICLAASGLCAHADIVRITATGTFDLPALGSGPTAVSLELTLPQDVEGAVPQSDAFTVQNLPVQAEFNGNTRTFTQTLTGWFAYNSFNYFGLDVRLSDVFAAGDRLQFIWATPESLYSGTNIAPTLLEASLSGLFASVTYYDPKGGFPNASTFDGTYDARTASVPEPTTALLLPLGLGALVLRRRRTG